MIANHVWIEKSEPTENDACDVIVRMEDGNHYTASFVTLAWLRRQLDLGFHGACDHPHCNPVRYVAIDTPHVLVDDLECDTLLDVIECMIDLGTFEGRFTLVSGDEAIHPGGVRTPCVTHEMVTLVISDVLSVTGVT